MVLVQEDVESGTDTSVWDESIWKPGVWVHFQHILRWVSTSFSLSSKDAPKSYKKTYYRQVESKHENVIIHVILDHKSHRVLEIEIYNSHLNWRKKTSIDVLVSFSMGQYMTKYNYLKIWYMGVQNLNIEKIIFKFSKSISCQCILQIQNFIYLQLEIY